MMSEVTSNKYTVGSRDGKGAPVEVLITHR
jgi:hypothetical protein